NGEYYISVTAANGLSNLSPVHYSMSVSTDGPPSIALIRPNGTASADQSMLVPTEVQISDDYGFSRLALHYRLAASKFAEPWKDFKSLSVPIPRGAISSLD